MICLFHLYLLLPIWLSVLENLNNNAYIFADCFVTCFSGDYFSAIELIWKHNSELVNSYKSYLPSYYGLMNWNWRITNIAEAQLLRRKQVVAFVFYNVKHFYRMQIHSQTMKNGCVLSNSTEKQMLMAYVYFGNLTGTLLHYISGSYWTHLFTAHDMMQK